MAPPRMVIFFITGKSRYAGTTAFTDPCEMYQVAGSIH